jgi:hypothetical protein
MLNGDPCGSEPAREPPQAAIHSHPKDLCSAIKKRRWLNQPTAFFLKLQSA